MANVEIGPKLDVGHLGLSKTCDNPAFKCNSSISYLIDFYKIIQPTPVLYYYYYLW